jgi:hypothetical protein
MAKVIQHLATAPSTGYTIFEDNQVLTKEPLNRLVDYLDDQERLTRVSLLGVGIFCGLRLSVGSTGIVLSKGVAVTTDGDLLRVPQDLTYTRFRTYGTEAPKYDPFYDGANMRKVFELVGEDVTGADTLDTFGSNVADMVGVLLMESFQKDADLCTGGDCDNKGKDALGNVKLLLMAPADVAALRETLPSFSKVSGQILPTYAKRVVLGAAIDSSAKLAAAYKAAAAATRGRLLTTLQQVLAVCGPFFPDVFAKDPLPDWTTKLNTAHPDSAAEQYFDHLEDVVDACNALGALLAGDTAVCCPPQAAFPKHVLLGLAGAVPLNLDADRTGCYPSPLVAGGRQTYDRARFMLRRIDTLIMSFTPIPTSLAVTITPSRTDDRTLDERAIPAHYGPAPAASWPIHRAWSYELERRGHGEFNYSANKAVFTPKGAAGEPLVASIAAASFLRVEGHLGKGVQAAMNTIEKAITASNLPFAVRAVLLHTDRTKITIKPGIRYNDLYRLHELFRHDLARQIDDTKAQVINYQVDVTEAVDNNVFSNTALGENVSIKSTAEQTMLKVSEAADDAVKGLDQNYTQYRAATWKPSADVVVEQSAGMWMTLGDVTKAEMGLSVAPLYMTYKPAWPEWLDEIIDNKNDDEDDKLLFKNFIARHPSAEHLGGVARGGTFVLIYVDGGTVVGDVTLPYYWPDDAEPEPAPRPLPKPTPLPVPKKPWKVRKPWDLVWKLDLDQFKLAEFEPFKQYTLDFPQNYFDALKQSTEILTTYTKPVTDGSRTVTFTDRQLGALVDSMVARTGSLEQQRKLMLDPAIDPAKQKEILTTIQKQEAELIETITEVARVATGPNVSTTDGASAVSLIADATSALSPKAATAAGTRLRQAIAPATVKPEMKTMMGGMLQGMQLG